MLRASFGRSVYPPRLSGMALYELRREAVSVFMLVEITVKDEDLYAKYMQRSDLVV